MVGIYADHNGGVMLKSLKAKSIKEDKRLAKEYSDKIKSLENELADLRKRQLSEPTIQRNVGELVQFGGIKLTTITEVLDGGLIYKTHQIVTDNNYGRPVDHERDMYIAWSDCVTYRPDNFDHSSIKTFAKRDHLRSSFYNTSVDCLVSMYYKKCNMNATYQRGSVWDDEDKKLLIYSIFNDIEIGKFTFVEIPFDEYVKTGFQTEILDGKQRLSALIDFIEGRFDYEGVLFRDMCQSDRVKITSAPVLVAKLNENTTYKQKLEHFLKVNTFGKPQDKQHIAFIKEELSKLS